MEIPQQLKNLKFCRIKKGTKKPFERDWVNKPYTFQEISKIENENYGILCGYEGLIVIDCDTSELKDSILKTMPKTFTVKTGSGGTHFYFICKEIKKKIVLQTKDKHYGEVQSFGTQVVGAGSLHPNGNIYQILTNSQIIEITTEQLTPAIKPFMKEIVKEEIKIIKDLKRYGSSDINSISILSIINTSKFKKASNGEYYGSNPWHGSSTGMNTWINPSKNVAHCFRCNSGINVAQAIALNEGIIKNCGDKITKEDFFKVLDIAKIKYKFNPPLKTKKINNKIIDEELYKIDKIILNYYGKKDLAEQILNISPIYYDPAKIWWKWDPKMFKWKVIDETDILNLVGKLSLANTISSKEKTEILEALKQESRKRKPKNIKKTWLQFQNKVIDIINGETFEATPDYFVTNPIPWKMHNENLELTPTIDKIFEEWVGQEHIKTLYEILAYCLLPDYPIHRLFCFIGAGMNGKSKFLDLLVNFIGTENVCSTELDTLLSSRFEKTKLHKKLVCIMGETNFNELNKTSILKKLTGGDLIGFEYKNKNPFEDKNYAKILIATNNLPETTDKTLGFYRRWCIIDFPNKFSEQKDILEDIPSEEYESLALKSTIILKDLLVNRNFYKEGTLEERERRYEEKSNPFDKFIKEFCDLEDINEHIWKFEFEKRFNEWCKENRFRVFSEKSIAMKMKEINILQGRLNASWLNNGKGGQLRAWLGIKWKV